MIFPATIPEAHVRVCDRCAPSLTRLIPFDALLLVVEPWLLLITVFLLFLDVFFFLCLDTLWGESTGQPTGVVGFAAPLERPGYYYYEC